jgi:diguanylate cyclase (GGDEF)-like protein
MPLNPTRKSLLEQMQIHELEISRRKELLGFTRRDAELLAACRPLMEVELEPLVAQFYEKQTSVDEIALIIGDLETLSRLRAAMSRYIMDLFSGIYDAAYVNSRLRIGLVHKRIGVAPKYYLSSMHLLKSLLMDMLGSRLSGSPEREPTLRALDKLLYFDNEFVFDTYIRGLVSEIESAKDNAVRHAVSLEHKVAERTRELEELARKDPLTGLYNQRYFMESLRRELTRGRRSGKPVTLMYFDLDGFKHVNDMSGHLVGDEVLRTVAQAMREQLRAYDVACRYGGDEFCALLPDTAAPAAREVAVRLQDALRTQAGFTPTLSIGLAQAGPTAWPGPEELLEASDQAMYEVKESGGNAIRIGATGNLDADSCDPSSVLARFTSSRPV